MIANMAICLFLSLLTFSVTTFFGSNAYRFYLPLLAGLTVALKNTAEEFARSSTANTPEATSNVKSGGPCYWGSLFSSFFHKPAMNIRSRRK